MDFPADVVDAVFRLRNRYKNSKHCVVMTFPILEIILVEDNKGKAQEVSTKFFFNYATNTFEMQAPDRRYYPKISHYDFNRTERRWSRNKGYIFKLIRDLKFCGLWKLILNKDIIIVNAYNEKTDPIELLDTLEKLTKE
jgi:hypothetical protein